MDKKLFCGNLGYEVTTQDLKTVFGAFGAVCDAQVVADRDTGRSKGFGFIELSSDAEAQAAIIGLHDTIQNGRPLTVNEAKPREKPKQWRRGRGKRYGASPM